ncbi:hypothetical protein KAX02_02840 [candidate division WOR-3 bacterium]|nr:hypothetical protein [candidate division WOR-3 bacterium]
MGYRNIKLELIPIETLMKECGLCDCEHNNYYGCTSKSKNKQNLGYCFTFDCPLAYEANLEDMKEYDKNLYEEYKQEEFDPIEMGAGWMVQYREVV